MNITKKQLKQITKFVLSEILAKPTAADRMRDNLEKITGADIVNQQPIYHNTKDAREFLTKIINQFEYNSHEILRNIIRNNKNQEYELLIHRLHDNQGTIWNMSVNWCEKLIEDFSDDNTSITAERIIKELRNHFNQYISQLNTTAQSIKEYNNLINAKHQIVELKNILVHIRESVKELLDLYDNLNAKKVATVRRRK